MSKTSEIRERWNGLMDAFYQQGTFDKLAWVRLIADCKKQGFRHLAYGVESSYLRFDQPSAEFLCRRDDQTATPDELLGRVRVK